MSLTVIFTVSFRSYEISCVVMGFIGFSWKNRWADILILRDSWWLSWLWKQSFSKTEKKILTSQVCSFFFYFLLPNVVNYRSNMTLWLSMESVKGDWSPKIYSFKECVMTLLTSTPIFRKESKLICHIRSSYRRRKTYSGQLQDSNASFGWMNDNI